VLRQKFPASEARFSRGFGCRPDCPDRPIGQHVAIRRKAGGQSFCELLESRKVQRIHARDNWNSQGKGFGDDRPETAPFGFVFAELVDDEDVRAAPKTGGNQTRGGFKRGRVKPATARQCAKVLADAQHWPAWQNLYVHVAGSGIRALGIDLNRSAASEPTRSKPGGKPVEDQVGIAPSGRHCVGKVHLGGPQFWQKG
jgi:hypothetical protein